MVMAAIAPAPDAHVAKSAEPIQLLSPKGSNSEAPSPSSQLSATPKVERRNRRAVTISFDSDPDEDEDQKHHLLHSVTQSIRSNIGTSPKGTPEQKLLDDEGDVPENYQDLKVSRFLTGCSYFSLKSTGKGTHQMEARLSRQKFVATHGPFMKVGLLMSLITIVTAVAGIVKKGEKEWIRFSIMLGGVSPLYLFYSWFALMHKSAFMKSSGTWRARMLVFLIFIQGIGIAFAEFIEDGEPDRTWFGSVVLHFVFIHNFTPLGAGEVQFTSNSCVVVHTILTYFLHQRRDDTVEETDPDELCVKTRGDAQLLLAVFVPCTLLLYQNFFLSLRRDRSMREDLLSSIYESAQRAQIQVETRKCEELLKSMLPRRIIKALKENKPVQPQFFNDCTVIFVEICNFGHLCAQLPAQLCVEILDGVYTELDRISDLLHVYKVETVNQVYMAVVGCPDLITNHADVAAIFGLAAQQVMPKVRHRIANLPLVDKMQQGTLAPAFVGDIPKTEAAKPLSITNFAERILDGKTLQIRVGINSGSVRAGVVGLACPRYKLIGDTVNTASRMESHCLPGKVQASPSTQERLTENMFVLEHRGGIEVKGKGSMQLAFVSAYADATNQDRMEVMIEYGVEQPVEEVVQNFGCRPSLERVHSHVTSQSVDTNHAVTGSVGLGSLKTTPLKKPSETSSRDHKRYNVGSSTPEVLVESAPPWLNAPENGSDPTRQVSDDSGFGSSENTPREGNRESQCHHVWTQNTQATSDSVASTLPHFVPSDPNSLHAADGDAMEKQISGTPSALPSKTISAKFRDSLVRPMPTWAMKSSNVNNSLRARLPFVHNALKRESWILSTPLSENANMYGSEDNETQSGITHRIISRAEQRWVQVNRWFLFTSDKLKDADMMRRLFEDRPTYLMQSLSARIALARNLTQVWLLVINAVSVIDFFMDVIEEDIDRYRAAIMFRAFGNNIAGLVYLLFITKEAVFNQHGELLTFIMLLCQGLSLNAKSMVIYNNESGIVALYGAYVLSYTVLRIHLRLPICVLAMIGYATVEMIRCEPDRLLKVVNNLGFLFVFFLFLACGVRLEEHLEHVADLEKRGVKRQMEDIEQAKKAGDELLSNMLPRHVVQEMNIGRWPTAEIYQDVTVIFTDIKNFTPYCASINVNQLVEFLNTLFSAFDDVLDLWGLYKVEVIGDAYFVSSGCPLPIDPKDRCWPHEYAMRAVEVALALQRTLPNVCDDPNVRMRVGVHSGEVLAGVVGKKGPRYHLFGQTVSRAEKMESTGMPNRVQISEETHGLLVQGGHAYDYELRDEPVVDPLKGPLKTYWVTRNVDGKTNAYKRGLMQQRRQSVAAR